MLIGISGTICSGKHTTAEYLVQHHGFLRLHLPTAQQTTQDRRFLPSVTDQKGTRGLTFPDVDGLLDFVTKRWQEHWVLTDIEDEDTLELLLRRPFFLLINVDAPITTRFRRFNARCVQRDLDPISLEDFIEANDTLLYGPSPSSPPPPSSPPIQPNQNRSTTKTTTPKSNPTGLATLHSRSHLSLLNSHPTVPSYFTFLTTLDLPSSTRLRPPWDTYFMTLAHLASLRSNCMKRRVGCVLIHNNRIISTGYNGTPRNLPNCNAGGCPRCNSAATGNLASCLCLHAEENALLEAGRERIREGSVLYCDTCPCLTCSVKIAQVGVKEVVFSQGYHVDQESRRVLEGAGVVLRQFVVPKGGLLGVQGAAAAGEGLGMEVVVRNGGG